eukprot:TRINITY_DN21242_c0_g1_i1.p1 TRINITY_DN21242_c0_g1~~TRINITY_DN21242_c0_g1_i1.p1  ORF type:complete len:458 (+),score=78.44 TRINITY_DN21242_c0_g1_i1:206-1579(+)
MSGGSKALPASLNVKNTFIDVRPSFVDDDGLDLETDSAFRKRQMSEPAPSFARQLSTRQTSGGEPHAITVSSLLEEDEDAERDEPEKEREPAWIQGTEGDMRENPTVVTRQETEHNWPTWDSLGAASNPIVVNSSLDNALQTLQGSSIWSPMFGDILGAAGGLARDGEMAGEDAAAWSEGRAASSQAALALAAQQAAQRGFAGGMEPSYEWEGKTTIMLRNLPNKYNQQMLLEELNTSGFLGTFDFLYLPIDPETHANRGYCFINFTDPSVAWMLKLQYEGRKMGRFNSDKVVSVVPAALQGFEANYAHYSTSRVNRGDPAARPLFLREPSLPGPKQDTTRRRGGRRSQGSLIDMATRTTGKGQEVEQPMAATYIGFPGRGVPSPPGALAGGSGASYGGKKGGSQRPMQTPMPPKPKSGGDEDVGTRPRFCPFCGGEAQPTFRFCQFCGASLNFDKS